MLQVDFIDLGRAPYRETWALQTAIQDRLIAEKLEERNGTFRGRRSNDVLLFVEHPHVYTLGKNGDPANLLKSEEELHDLHAEYVKIDRGGDITYHGPGQIVGYPILDLERHFPDIHKYMRYLEEVMIRVCKDYGIEAGRISGLTGAWVNNAKICAMGVRCSRWVTMHGFAFNVMTSLDYFNNIVPCGISDKQVTSLEQLTGEKISMQEVKEKMLKKFAEVFEVEIVPVTTLPEFEKEFAYFNDKQF